MSRNCIGRIDFALQRRQSILDEGIALNSEPVELGEDALGRRNVARDDTEKDVAGSLPPLDSLHERHSGVTPIVCAYFGEAARCMLSMHHVSPCLLSIRNNQSKKKRTISWSAVSEKDRYAHANLDDATRDGAYIVAVAVVEAELGLFTVERATTRTGCDFYASPHQDPDDLEEAYRLEVSGTNLGNESDVRTRLKEKIEQTRRAGAILPAVACVVGFEARTVMIEKAEAD
ncbi:hypothetical protein OV208_15340 [Corallococcus sp. bb12-1]|uniref:hypothetical protein n=1 Tax=Corallococcus sp. bb12-1 TaxID=2996784 RepID=UPI0022717731|nr:hypothetical protein [Corallococcus sp. bb12-1]MCY1042698.1 hypothetical protein [Corallococcus sp. bb12-1]